MDIGNWNTTPNRFRGLFEFTAGVPRRVVFVNSDTCVCDALRAHGNANRDLRIVVGRCIAGQHEAPSGNRELRTAGKRE